MRKTAGVLLAVAGVGYALAERAAGVATDQAWIGDLAVLASALVGALCSVLYRPYLRRYPALPVSTTAMLASVLFLALVTAFEGAFGKIPQVTVNGWYAIGFIGLSSGIGYFLWLWALRHAPASGVTAFSSRSVR